MLETAATKADENLLVSGLGEDREVGGISGRANLYVALLQT